MARACSSPAVYAKSYHLLNVPLADLLLAVVEHMYSSSTRGKSRCHVGGESV